MPVRCKTKPDGSLALPVVTLPERKKKARVGKWRAGVLIAVHLLIIAHIVQWLIVGKTVSPIEQSEYMQTLEQGFLTAGAIIFAIAILSTVLFGRYVCGWLCHVVALQDFCHWLMGKLGVRPKPFRARLLMLAPLTLGLYMFVWPSFKRHALQPAFETMNLAWPAWLRRTDPFPGLQSELVVDDFWATFPEWYIAIPFLLVCGFATVYFLGAKAFCTYACPYGGLFALVEPASPPRVRVDYAKCHECGLCTAACTSNVRVHEEIKHHGMVIDAGCMKTMDCINACPNDALSIGLGRPAIGSPVRAEATESHAQAKDKADRRWHLTWPQEIAFALVILYLFVATRGMFDRVPMLMAGGLAAGGTGLTVLLWKTVTMSNTRIHRVALKQRGTLKPAGIVFIILMMGGWTAAAWGGLGNITRWQAEIIHANISVPVDVVLRPEYAPSTDTVARAERALRWFERADAPQNGGIGWTLNPDDHVRIAYLHAVQAEYTEAADQLRIVIDEGNPTDALVFQLLQLHASAARIKADAAGDMGIRGKVIAEANEQYYAILENALDRHPHLHNVRLRLAQENWNRGTYDATIWDLDDEKITSDPKFILNSGQLKALAGDREGMTETLDRVIAALPEDGTPDDPAILFEASQLARSIGRAADADKLLTRGVAHAHDAPAYLTAANIFAGPGRPDDARRMLDKARDAHQGSLPGIRFQIGRTLYTMNAPPPQGNADKQRALDEINAAIDELDHDPWQHFSALTALAGLASQSQDMDLLTKTIAKLEKLIDDNTGEPLFHHDLSGFLFNVGRDDDAMAQLAPAAGLATDNAFLAARAAQVHARLGKAEEAQQWAERGAERKRKAAESLKP